MDRRKKKRTGVTWRLGLLFFIMAAILCLGCGKTSSQSEKISAVSGKLEIHYLDIGQGDCTLIVNGDHAMLIDAGNNDKGTKVQAYLESQGIKNLDYAIGTHPDADHIGGLDVILYKFPCKTIIMPDVSKDTATYRDVISAINEKNEKITYPKVGDTYQLGDASFTIIAPNNSKYAGTNDYSVGLMLTYGSNKFLFIGDAEEPSEEEMLENGISLAADVYKVGHHGSKTATTDDFLTAVNPTYAIISCGEGNRYGHPHAEVLNKLQMAGISMFRTDDQGTIVASSDGTNITFNMSPSDNWTPGEPKGSSTDWEEDDNASKSSSDTTDSSEKQAFVLNVSSKKFHLPECGSAAKISDKNRKEVTSTKEELIKEGYEPCNTCIGK